MTTVVLAILWTDQSYALLGGRTRMHEQLSSDEVARQAVLARFGITAESKDYNLDRIVRVGS